VEADERSEGQVAGKPRNREPSWIAWERDCHGANPSASAEHLHRQSEELAIAIGKAVVWIIVTLEFRRCPTAEGVSDAVNPWRPSMRVAREEGSRGGVPCHSKGTA